MKVEKHKKGGFNCVLEIQIFLVLKTIYAADIETNSRRWRKKER
jgi:hypothetical protein